MTRTTVLTGIAGLLLAPRAAGAVPTPVSHSDPEWRKLLSPDSYHVLREAGTERPFSSPLDEEKRPGTYACLGCDLPLFSSKAKFDSGTGWPSFWAPLPGAVTPSSGGSMMFGTEVHCRRCEGHLGHIFDDGPKPPGPRSLINGVAVRVRRGRAA